MSVRTLFTISILGAGLWAGGAMATSMTPAELPPAGYAGSQYVDSKGCIFVRAGSGGNVTWIPRMDRARNQMCNAQPSAVARVEPPVVQGTTTTASAASLRPSPNLSQPRVATTIPVTTPTTTNMLIGGNRVVRTTAPSTQPRATSRVPLVVNPTVTVPQTSRTASACPGASPLSRQYINHGQHGPVRCGPQPVHPMDVYRPNGARPTTNSTGALTYAFGARPPFEPVNAAPRTPAGYRMAWEDGRLNPNRGPGGTYAAATTHAPLTAATVSTRNAPAATRAPAAAPQTAPDGRVAVRVGVGHRFVQVGTYRQPASTQRAIQILQRIGLPAARTSVTSGGQRYDVVLAGPFADSSALGSALYRARQAGFTDAITRR